MIRIRLPLIAVLLLSASITISACRSTVIHSRTVNPKITAKRTGPPPHAPAHGYRHKHRDGVELVYKSDIGVYVVVGYDGHYFHKDTYYRLRDDRWQVSVRIDGKWTPVSKKKIPPGLRKRHVCKKK
jgi:hypothetical protein